MTLKQVVFLDRDGVVNRDSSDYIKSWDEFEFLRGSLNALRDLTQGGYHLILITNQSMVGRGMVPLEVLQEIHCRMQEQVETIGGKIFDIFFCPHRPDEHCTCRKPKPGMIKQAQKRYSIDLRQAIMIGDSTKDIQCGRNAGCNTNILVQTGNGSMAKKELAAQNIQPSAIVADLFQAAQMILAGNILSEHCI